MHVKAQSIRAHQNTKLQTVNSKIQPFLDVDGKVNVVVVPNFCLN